jgi:hypothetical protein
MITRLRRILLAGAALLASGSAAANPASAPASAASLYGLTARVRLAERQARTRYVHDIGFPGGPANPSCVVAVGEQTAAAYAAAVQRMFRPAQDSVPADLEAEVYDVAADVEKRDSTFRAFVAHRIVVRTPDGAELGRFQVEGRAPIAPIDASAMHLAFARAADDAARRFERAFDASPDVARWLAGRGLARRATDVPLPPEPQAREAWVGFTEAGIGWNAGAGDSGGAAITARAGASSRWLLAQATFGRWRTTLNQYSGFYPGVRLDGMAFGIDVAAVYRIRRPLELRAGAGAHYLRAQGAKDDLLSVVTFEQDGTAGSVFAAAELTDVVARWFGLRGRVGVEVRRYFGPGVHAHMYGRDVSIAGTELALFLGVELPLVRRREAAAPVAAGM